MLADRLLAQSWSDAMSRRTDENAWRYLAPNGRRVHLLVGARQMAVCGVSGGTWFDSNGWRGNGSDGERDMAERLPPCRRCVEISGVTR